MNAVRTLALLAGALVFLPTDTRASDAPPSVRLVTLDPGHFHAALLQKEMLPGVDRRVDVYAPPGPDLTAHLGRINAFNTRAQNPTCWETEVHATPDFMTRLLAEKPGNVVVLSGNNRGKIARIESLVRAGFHVLGDKPWIIEAPEFPALERTLALARQQRVAVYDAMTQRYEVTCLLQRELVNDAGVFGSILKGTPLQPGVHLESVHFLKKEVAGAPLIRPAWFFDPKQLGEPLADVGTHLVDLVQWMLSPDRPLDYRQDIAVLRGSRKTLPLTRDQFKAVTGLAAFPPFLQESVRHDRLDYVAENSVNYTLRGVHVKLDVLWAFAAPAGGADTELAVFRGSRARVEVRQGRAEKFIPEVFVIPNRLEQRVAVGTALRARLAALESVLPGLDVRATEGGFRVVIPSALRASHESHFALLVRQFLAYQKQPDTLPEWERAFMLAKYFVTTEGVRLAREQPGGVAAAMNPLNP